jgi:hypothetical protein
MIMGAFQKPDRRSSETFLHMLLYRLVTVIIPSNIIPATRRIFKESVKVCTPKSPPSADDSARDLTALNVFTHGAGIQPEHSRRLTEGEKVLSNRLCGCLFFMRHGRPRFQRISFSLDFEL